MAAYGRVNTVRTSARFSPEVPRDERLYWYANGGLGLGVLPSRPVKLRIR